VTPSLDCWLKEDVARILRAARLAARAGMEAPAISDADTDAYWRGYTAELATIAAAFGLACEEPRVIEMQRRPVLPVAHRPGRAGDDWPCRARRRHRPGRAGGGDETREKVALGRSQGWAGRVAGWQIQ
jgi:hypothetical protein